MITYPAAIGGVQTRVFEAGEGQRYLVLVHGLGARADRWSRNVDVLAAAGYHVYAFDLPGHGFAAKGPDLRYTVPAFAEVVDSFFDFIGADRAILIGTSLGGHTAGWFACDHPDRIEALVLVATTGLTALGAERRAGTRARVGDASREGVARKLSIVIHDQSLVTADWIEEESRINSSPGAAEGFRSLGEYFGEHLDDDLIVDRLSALTLEQAFPLLLIWGAQDVGFPVAMGETAHELLPNSSLVIIDGAAHAPYFERPEAFNHVVVDFLEGQLGRWQAPGVDYR